MFCKRGNKCKTSFKIKSSLIEFIDNDRTLAVCYSEFMGKYKRILNNSFKII